MTDSGLVAAFWAEFVAATGADATPTAWGFGDDEKPALMTELGLLVRDGPKRATTSLVSDYGPDDDPMPRPGDFSVILDGDGRPLCIIRTTAVEVRAYGDVDEAFAWDEGEGDRSLADWRRVHEWYFDSVGTPVTDETLVVVDKSGKKQVVRAETVVLAIGSKPNTRLFKALEGKVGEIHLAGDCVKPRKILQAIDEASQIARQV